MKTLDESLTCKDMFQQPYQISIPSVGKKHADTIAFNEPLPLYSCRSPKSHKPFPKSPECWSMCEDEIRAGDALARSR